MPKKESIKGQFFKSVTVDAAQTNYTQEALNQALKKKHIVN